MLAIPWAINQSGLVLGVVLMFVMAAVSFYTAYRIVQSPGALGKHLTYLRNLVTYSYIFSALDTSTPDFSDVCHFFWGKWGEYFSVFFSVLVLIGGVVLYFVLMSNFLYFTGNVIYGLLLFEGYY
jgi:solute carrier family 38 (sodium-coupled neutral amino acid transporter), member 9